MRRKKKTMEGGERAQSHRSGGGGGGGSELFVCFTARPSSSAASASMRVPSTKSLLSPGRGRDPAAPSLSASLSRRLRSSGSLKGGQSPMFPAGVAAGGGAGRRKGCAFEAAEPSSPKVTCIGQVRVKSKKKAKAKAAAMAKSRSKRGSGKEASFRRTEEECLPRKNQRWVHQLPASICEGLRTFGSEINCFLPCGGSPCSSSRTGKGQRRECEEKRATGSCGQVLARWMVAMQEGEEGKRGDVVGLVLEERGKGELDLVIGEREKREVEGLELEVGNGNGAEKKDEVLVVRDGEEEDTRVSVCIPPRNALLLMRCRSDPVRMAALASRFWGSPATKVEVEEEEEEEEDGVEVGQHLFGRVEVDREEVGAKRDAEPAAAAEASPESGEVDKDEAEEKNISGATMDVALEERASSAEEEKHQRWSEEKKVGDENGGESLKEGSSADCVEVQRNPPREEVEDAHLSEEVVFKEEARLPEREEEKEGEEEKGRRPSSCSSSVGKEERRSQNNKRLSKAKEGGRRRSSASKDKERRRHSFSTEGDIRRQSFSSEKEARRASFSVEGRRRWSFSIDKEDLIPEEENALREEEEEKKEESSAEGEEARETEAVEKPKATEVGEIEVNGEEGRREEVDGGGEEGVKGEEEKRRELPDCLLLMMYEPKVSMEVSKETWVCSTDFLRWRPHHHRRRQPKGGGGGGGGGEGEGEGERAKAEKVDSSEDRGGDNEEVTAPAEPAVLQAPPPPPPPAPPTASAVEQKLISAAAVPKPAAYGPFGLTRCKSEPMRSSARLAPDACFWKDRHRPIGAAGIGF